MTSEETAHQCFNVKAKPSHLAGITTDEKDAREPLEILRCMVALTMAHKTYIKMQQNIFKTCKCIAEKQAVSI